MEKPSLTEVQRKQYMRLLTQAQKRAEEDLESIYTLKNRVETEIAPKLVKEHGASNLIAKIHKLRKQIEDAKKSLLRLGFELNCSNSILLRSDPPKTLQKALDDAIEEAKNERDELPRKYRDAILDLAAATSAEDAKQIVKDLL